MTWKTSSYSGGGGTCVEADGPWRTSSHSGSNGGNCVETAMCTAVHIRDTKARELATITVSADAWTAFLAGLTA